MVISIFLNYQQQQISVYAQQVVKVSRRSDGGKFIKMSFKNVRYGSQKTVSNHLKGAFFWGHYGYSYSGLGITEYTEFQFRKECSYMFQIWKRNRR